MDTGSEGSERRLGRPAVVARVATAVVAYGAAWWIVALPPFSASATVAVLIAGGVAAVVGAVTRPERSPPSGGCTWIAGWVVLAAAAGGWQLAAWLQQPRDDHPTLSSLANAILDTHPARAAAFVLWLAATFALVRR